MKMRDTAIKSLRATHSYKRVSELVGLPRDEVVSICESMDYPRLGQFTDKQLVLIAKYSEVEFGWYSSGKREPTLSAKQLDTEQRQQLIDLLLVLLCTCDYDSENETRRAILISLNDCFEGVA